MADLGTPSESNSQIRVLGREIIRAMRVGLTNVAAERCPPLVSILEMATPEKRRQYADDFIRSLNQYLRKGVS